MLSQKRRKKRQSHGLRTIELQRGKQGYGFTISGQQPCVLGNIIPGSPADDQGMYECYSYACITYESAVALNQKAAQYA